MVIANELHVLVYESPVGLRVKEMDRKSWLGLSATLIWTRQDFLGVPVWVKRQSWITVPEMLAVIRVWLHEREQEVL